MKALGLRAGLALCLVVLAGAPAAAQSFSLKVGIDTFEPYQMTGEELSGIDIDLIRAVVKQAGLTLEFAKAPWIRQLKQLESGEFDVLLDASKTPDRADYALWTDSYRQERTALICLKNNLPRIKTFAQALASGLTIGVIKDAWYGQEVKDLLDKPENRNRIEAVSAGQLNRSKLAGGHLSLILDDPVALQYLVKLGKYQPVRVIQDVLDDDVYFMVSRKTVARHPDLLDRLNKVLALLKKNGTFKAIFAKYGVSE